MSAKDALIQHLPAAIAWALVAWLVWQRLLAPRLAGVQSLDAAGFLRLRDQNPVVVDVRTPAEQAAGYPKGALLIPLAELAQRAHEIPKGRPVVCICASGMRSARAAVWLARHGYKPVYNFSGGFAAWRAAGLPMAR